MVSIAAVWANHWFDRQIPPRFSLAVLPFVYRGTDADRRYIADDVTVNLTTDLTQDPQATVASAAAADTYRGRAADPREVGRALNVRYAITGGLREDGATIRLDVHLASTESGTELWSDRFEESADGSEARQERIAAHLRGGLQAALVQFESARSRRERPDTPDAFDIFLHARELQ
jgi:adenylate cyclase